MLQSEKSLKLLDWNFADSVNNSGIHAIHPYPAKFIPQIPRQLIDLLYQDNSAVILDPFSGSGTTLVEAMDAGIDAYGIDLHPLACLISKVKTTPITSDFAKNIVDVLTKARERIKRQVLQIPPIPRLDHWFEKPVQEALAALVTEINDVPDGDVADALRIALSSIIVQVSNQDSDTRYAAIKNDIDTEGVFQRFERAANALNDTLNEHFSDKDKSLGKVTILHQDVLTVTPNDLPRNIGLVITSPPYPNAYEYWLYHKYRMYWLGMDPLEVRSKEIGARPHYFKKNHQDEHDFERQMSICFQLLSQVMIPNGKACFIVGRSIIHGRRIDNVELLIRAATPHGFTVEAVIEREIPQTRKAFNPSHGKINQEHLVVFELSNSR